jgi:hypothetical protein
MIQLSLEDLRAAVADELVEKFGTDSYGTPNYSVVETYPDYIIAIGPNQQMYKIAFKVVEPSMEPGEAYDIELGDPQAVDVAYVPVSQAAHFLASQAAATDDWAFPIQAMEAGWTRGSIAMKGKEGMPQYFPPEVIAQVAAALNGAKFGRAHPSQGNGADQPERIAGWIDGGKLVGNAAVGVAHLLESETDLQQKLLAARKANKLDLFGVSVLGYFGFKTGKVEGKEALVATSLGKLVSVDLVAEAGAGGKFLYSAAAAMFSEIAEMQSRSQQNSGPQNGRIKGAAVMKQSILKILETLRSHDAGRAATLTAQFAALSEDRYGDFLVTVTQAVTDISKTQSGNAAAEALVAQAKTMLDEAKRLESKNLVEKLLGESKLPQPAQALVRKHLSDRIVDEKEINAEIVGVRSAFAAFSDIGRVTSEVRVGLESVDKVQLAMDSMLGVKAALSDPNTKPFRGIKDAYIVITGDSSMSFGKNGAGGFTRVTQAIATSDFPNILLNSMTKRLIQDYAEVGMNGLDNLITTGPALTDYKTQDRVRDGYFGDLPDVSQAAGYQELTKPTDERITYAPGKKGGLLTISEETIRNDDLGAIARFPTRLARAGRHTLKSFITNFFINNPNYIPDGVAWFHVTHGNLITTPLAVDTLTAAEISLMKQTEKDSGNRLGFRIQWLMVPVDLAAQAWQINNAQNYNPGPALQLPNPFYQRFGNNSQYIIVNELLTDTNDFYYGVLPSNVPFLEIGYLDGIQEPQIFIANLPTQGTQFTNDQIQYKTKFVFGGAPIDFRPVSKAVVP